MMQLIPNSLPKMGLVMDARRYVASLHEAGFTASVDLRVGNAQVVKIAVRRGGKPLGHVSVRRSRTGHKVHFHEITNPDYAAAMEVACTRCPVLARDLVEMADYSSDPSNYVDHAFVAAFGTPAASCYAVVVERKGVVTHTLEGVVEASPQEAEAVGATRLIERCPDMGVERIAVHAGTLVVHTTAGAYRVKVPSARGLAAAAEATPCTVLWTPRTSVDRGSRYARQLAEKGFAEL